MNRVVKFYEIIKPFTKIGKRKKNVFNYHGSCRNDIMSSMIKAQTPVISTVKPITKTRGALIDQVF